MALPVRRAETAQSPGVVGPQPEARRWAVPRRRRRRPAVALILGLWLVGFAGAAVSCAMIGEGYRVDALETQLTALTRSEQWDAGRLALDLSPAALQADARREHVALAPVAAALPLTPPPHVRRPGPPSAGLSGLLHELRAWFRNLAQGEG